MSKCLYCGAEITGRKRKYCSSKCRNGFHNSQIKWEHPEHNCHVCGKHFIVKANGASTKYCSAECRDEERRRKNRARMKEFNAEHHQVKGDYGMKPCVWCGQLFVPSWGNPSQKYCSEKCRIQKRFYVPPKKYICKICGTEFEATRKQLYCSEECKNAKYLRIISIKKSITQYQGICVICGGKFESIYPSQCTCSEECREKYNLISKQTSRRLRKTRYKNATHQDGVNLINVAKRDNNICYLCGKPVDWSDSNHNTDLSPSIDHVVPLSLGGNDTWDNVRLAHRLCNSKKGNKQWLN